MLVAISAGGVYLTEDGGVTWQPANKGVRAENKPERYPESGHNVHRLVMHRGMPKRLYRQCYNGTYRSDDGGASWLEMTDGLPSDFGYAIAIDPNDPETVFQIPETSAQMLRLNLVCHEGYCSRKDKGLTRAKEGRQSQQYPAQLAHGKPGYTAAS